MNSNSFSGPLFHCACLGLLLSMAGCASVSVANINSKGASPRRLPQKIYVQEFDAPLENFRVDRDGDDLTAFVKNEQHALAVSLVQQLSKYIAPAEILPERSSGASLPHGNEWLVRGVFDRVNQGSRLLRAGVGFGAGGTKMETRVRIFDLSRDPHSPFLTMLTTGGSGMAPGAWAAFTPAFVFYWPGAVANAGGASLSGISVDRTRTVREIAATLSEYCFDHGLIPEYRVRRPKRLGLLPALQRPDFAIPASGP